MQQTATRPRRCLWHPALPYALDYLGLVLITAALSMLWFNSRLGSLLLAVPMGVAFTVLASMVFYRWQHRRWLKRKSALDRQALALWLADELLSGTAEELRELTCDLLCSQKGYKLTFVSGKPLLATASGAWRLYCLRRHPSCPVDAQQLMQLKAASDRTGMGAAVSTTAGFTEPAREYARRAGLLLVGLDELADMAQAAGMQPRRRRSHYTGCCRKPPLPAAPWPAGQPSSYLSGICWARCCWGSWGGFPPGAAGTGPPPYSAPSWPRLRP
ncbi:MAG: restriction endonuclease [Christensenellaceae bacterium]